MADTQAERNQKARAKYWLRIQAGICVRDGCPMPVELGRIYCLSHVLQNRMKVAKWTSNPDNRQHLQHKQQRRERRRMAITTERRATGMCVAESCSLPALAGYRRCETQSAETECHHETTRSEP